MLQEIGNLSDGIEERYSLRVQCVKGSNCDIRHPAGCEDRAVTSRKSEATGSEVQVRKLLCDSIKSLSKQMVF